MTAFRLQFTIRRCMVAVTIGGLILAFVSILRMPVEFQQALRLVVIAIGVLLLVWSPVIIEGVRNFRRFNVSNPRARHTQKVP